MLFELILFAIYFGSALVVSRFIEKYHNDPELSTISQQEGEIMHVLPWVPFYNTSLAIGFINTSSVFFLRKLRLKIWIWYAVKITKLYIDVQCKMLKKHGSKWNFDDINDEIKNNLPK